MAGIDETVFSLLLHPTAKPPRDPATKKPIERLEDRIEKLIENLSSEAEKLILPTPALSEFLILAGQDAPAYLDRLAEMRFIEVRPFDTKAAIELAAVEIEDRKKGDKRGGSANTWAKVRFDRQILAICKTNGAKLIYSDDEGIIKFAPKFGLEVVSTWDLTLPAAKQTKMFDESGEATSTGEGENAEDE